MTIPPLCLLSFHDTMLVHDNGNNSLQDKQDAIKLDNNSLNHLLRGPSTLQG